MIFFTVIGALLIAVIAHAVIDWCLRYRRASRQAEELGLPFVFAPFSELNHAWGGFQRTALYPLIFERLLPSSITTWVKYTKPEWRWVRKYEFYEELGDVWGIVSAAGLTLHIADPDLLYDILRRASDFTKVDSISAVMDFYGSNIMVVEGAEWKHHRKIVGPPFSESNNQLVWKETIRQLTQLMDIWSCAPDAKVPVIATQGLKDAALNVISYAGFGVQAEPITASSVSNTGSSGVGLSGTQFSQSLCTVTSDFRQTIMAIMLPPRLVKLIPGLNKVKVAYMEFREYLLQLLHTGQEALAAPEDEKKSHRSDNLLDRLLRSEKEAKASGQGRGLTESEILGNTFIMVIAGHETTAATFDYCVAYMCMNEDKQEWLLTELDRALEGQSDDPNEWPYELHKELTAIICVMYEILRLCPPVNSTLRDNKQTPQVIHYNNKDYLLPPMTTVNIQFVGVHYNPKYWGPDVKEFKPERWDIRDKQIEEQIEEGELTTPKLRYPGVLAPRKGTFMPFGDGNRACLGRRFAEVEMIAALAVLFSKHRVEVALKPGETKEEGKKRVQQSIDSSWSALVTCIREPVEVTFTRRK